MAEIIQNDLSAIGVESTIINYDAGSYVGTLMDVSTFDIGLLYVGSPSRFAVDMIGGYLSFLPLGWDGVIRMLSGALPGRRGHTHRKRTQRNTETNDGDLGQLPSVVRAG
jgi:hypothetical protein